MKIMLYVNSYLPTIGGRELVVHLLARSYQELGHEVRVVGPGCLWKHRKTKFSYPLHRWPRLPLLSRDTAETILFFLSKIIFRPDVVHAHSTYPTGYIAARVKKYLNFPLIITPHGEDIHIVPEINFGQRLDPIQNKKILYALKKAEFTTAISDSVATSIANAEVPKEKIISIPNGVDLKRFQKKQNINVYEYLGFPSDSKLIVTIGNYHPRKGHEVLIDSIKLAKEKDPLVRLVVVGRTSPTLLDSVRQEGLNAYVKFTGPLEVPIDVISSKVDILAALLNEAKIYVSSSVGEGAEGMSLALLEAMCAGACPIVTDISGNRDIVKNGINGLVVPPSSPKEMADAIVQLTQDEKKRVQLRDSAIELAKQFGWVEVAKKYVDLYQVAIEKCNAIRV